MTTQELYTKLIGGDITEQKFLYEARRDSRLPFITKFNSLKDTIQILKNKGIISEKAAKEATGKQEVEIISKTIDMVNPYEYSRGMDYELGIVIDAAGNADLDEDKIAKAQKKVLKNLTNNPGYYSQKLIPQTEGESEYEVEVNAKSIEALKKKQGKIIREHGEEYDRVADVNADSSPLEEKYSIFKNYDDIVGGIVVRFGALEKYVKENEPSAMDDLKKSIDAFFAFDDYMTYGSQNELEEHGQYFDRVADVNADSSPLEETDIEEGEGKSLQDLEMGEKFTFNGKTFIFIKHIEGNIAKVILPNGDTSTVSFGGGRVNTGKKADIGPDYFGQGKGHHIDEVASTSSPLEETDIEELGKTRDSIYEKYAKKYGVDVNELKDRIEAIKLEKEAIEVEDEDTAIAVQKKSPEADVRIVKK